MGLEFYAVIFASHSSTDSSSRYGKVILGLFVGKSVRDENQSLTDNLVVAAMVHG